MSLNISKLKKVLLASILLLLSSAIAAQEEPDWFLQAIKSDTPGDLAHYIYVSEECSFTEERVKSIVEGVFIRSRIKPIDNFGDKPIHLEIAVECLPLEGTNPIYSFSVFFSRYNPRPSIYYAYNFGTFGIGEIDDALQSIKGSVEEAITAYIKANFDL
jgi:hypothetical protein